MRLERELQAVRQRCRLLMIMSALERTGIAPISMNKLHAFAYLSDVLSPVWGFLPYDGTVLKIEEGPHYSELQAEIDALVILGLINVLDLTYRMTGDAGARIDGWYELRFESEHLPGILDKLGADPASDPLDPRDTLRNKYLLELAAAMAALPDDEIDKAAQFDATYADPSLGYSNVVHLDRGSAHRLPNRSIEITERFENFLPDEAGLSPGEKVYLYASYLGEKINAG